MLKEAYGECAVWSDQFEQFVEFGKADKEFETHLDVCPTCQMAMDQAFDKSVVAFEELARDLRKGRPVLRQGLSSFHYGVLVGLFTGCTIGLLLGMYLVKTLFS